MVGPTFGEREEVVDVRGIFGAAIPARVVDDGPAVVLRDVPFFGGHFGVEAHLAPTLRSPPWSWVDRVELVVPLLSCDAQSVLVLLVPDGPSRSTFILGLREVPVPALLGKFGPVPGAVVLLVVIHAHAVAMDHLIAVADGARSRDAADGRIENDAFGQSTGMQLAQPGLLASTLAARMLTGQLMLFDARPQRVAGPLPSVVVRDAPAASQM